MVWEVFQNMFWKNISYRSHWKTRDSPRFIVDTHDSSTRVAYCKFRPRMLSLGLTRLSSLAVCLSRKVVYAERIATSLHLAAIDLERHRDRRDLVKTQPKKDEGSSGETRTDIRPQQES